jgi:hypothetical protein
MITREVSGLGKSYGEHFKVENNMILKRTDEDKSEEEE